MLLVTSKLSQKHIHQEPWLLVCFLWACEDIWIVKSFTWGETLANQNNRKQIKEAWRRHTASSNHIAADLPVVPPSDRFNDLYVFTSSQKKTNSQGSWFMYFWDSLLVTKSIYTAWMFSVLLLLLEATPWPDICQLSYKKERNNSLSLCKWYSKCVKLKKENFIYMRLPSWRVLHASAKKTRNEWIFIMISMVGGKRYVRGLG